MTASKLCDLLERTIFNEGLESPTSGMTADYRTLYFTVLGEDGRIFVVSITAEDGLVL